ncbi:MAG: hypothetical protein IT327_25975 [Anaerolineae bacterium]|nr:hypothetical protein [Anaerolineae bacterium]
MRQTLEQTEGHIQHLEQRTEQVEDKLEDINEKLHLIEKSIANLYKQEDAETAEALHINLKFRQKEQETAQNEIDRIIGELDSAEQELSEVQAQNEDSRAEVESLQKLDENVDNALQQISQRDEIIRVQEQQCHALRERLGGKLTGDITTYVPRTTPPISERIKWVDVGMQSVSVNDLPVPEGISDAKDFKKISMDRMTNGIFKLQEMKSAISSGEGANSDFWADFDRQQGLEYSNGYQQVYDAFFGGDAIKVTFDGKNYDIVNGRHRIWLAKRLGIDFLPIRVTKKVEK